MEIPISGFLYEPEGDDPTHTHKLYITSWNRQPVHSHDLAGTTSFDVGHDHRYAGRTAPAPSGVPHIHAYAAVTTFNSGHLHYIRGVTGPAIPVPGGGHIHQFDGYTTVSGATPHRHHYGGETDKAL
ncbi:hypothetical protein SD71_01755 [Cohnella kolymensis]|uniref:YmaF family protein n=1 Tax=Cohnella kolymensis TaxID=1590652 RepID=A0ABR5A8P4_9BACL|nr:YmaF family protein [Cohnella kolymensis]KIL37410.1 hypothetical protein SD71_01755 [Cohnella kolymensis]